MQADKSSPIGLMVEVRLWLCATLTWGEAPSEVTQEGAYHARLGPISRGLQRWRLIAVLDW